LDVIVISAAFQQFLTENHLIDQFGSLHPEHMVWLEGVYLTYPDPQYRLFMLKMALHCIVLFMDNYKELYAMIADYNLEQQIYMMKMFDTKNISLELYNHLIQQLIRLGLWADYKVEEFYQYSRQKIKLLIQCVHILETYQLFDANIFRYLSQGISDSTLSEVHEILKQLSASGCLNTQILQGLFFPKDTQLTNQQMQCATQIYIALHSKNINVDYLIPYFKDFATDTFQHAYNFLMSLPNRVYAYPAFIISLMRLPYPEYFYENFNLLIALLDINPDFNIYEFYTSHFENIHLITIGLEYLRIFEYLDETTFKWLDTQKEPDLSAHLFVLLHKYYTLSIDTIDNALEFESLETLLIGIRMLENNDLFIEHHLNLLIDSGFPEEFAEIIILCHNRRLDLQFVVNALEKKLVTSCLLKNTVNAVEILFENDQLTLENLLLILKTDNLEMAANLVFLANDFDMDEQLLTRFISHSNPESRLKAHQYILHDATTAVDNWHDILEISAHPLMTLYFWDMLSKNDLLDEGVEVYVLPLTLQVFEYLYQKNIHDLDKELLSILKDFPEISTPIEIECLAEGLLYLHQRKIYSRDNLELLLNHPYPQNILFFLKIQLAINEDDYRMKVSLEHADLFNDLNHDIFWKYFIGHKLQFSSIISLLNAPLSNKKTISQIQSSTHFLAFYIQENKAWNTQLYNVMSQQLAFNFNHWLTSNLAENKAKKIIQYFKDLMCRNTSLFPESTLTLQEHLYYLLLLSTEMKISVNNFYQQLYQCFDAIFQNLVGPQFINYRHFEPLTRWVHNHYLQIDQKYHDMYHAFHYFRLAYRHVIKQKIVSEEGKFEYFDWLRLLSTNQFEKIWALIDADVHEEFVKIYPQGHLNLYAYLRTNFSQFRIELDNKSHMDLICLGVFEERCRMVPMSQNIEFFVNVKQEMMNHCVSINKSLPRLELEQRINEKFFQLIQMHPELSCRSPMAAESETQATYDFGCSSGR
jgi:hypothetical protein